MWIWPITLPLKGFRIYLFPFLRLNDVVPDRLSTLLTFLFRFLHRPARGGDPADNLHHFLHPADPGEGPKSPLHLLMRSMDPEGGLGYALYNPLKEHSH
jgi:hypothetical protein